MRAGAAPHELKAGAGADTKQGKANALIQAWVSRWRLESFSLTADMMYVSQNAPRLARALFEVCLRRKWAQASELLLGLCKVRDVAVAFFLLVSGRGEGGRALAGRQRRRFCLSLSLAPFSWPLSHPPPKKNNNNNNTPQYAQALELRMWPHEHPLRQLEACPQLALGHDLLSRLEDRGLTLERLCDSAPSASEIAATLRLPPASGARVRAAIRAFPRLELRATLSPITRTVLRVQLSLEAAFEWVDRAHGSALRWWVWVEDAASEALLHAETWTLTKKVRRFCAWGCVGGWVGG